MATHLIRKLERYTRLSDDDKRALEQVAALRVRALDPRQDIVQEGDKPQQVHLILDGWACRYKRLEDGRRQIVNYLLPGDVCDLGMFILKQMDHSIGTISAVRVAEIPKDAILHLTNAHPRISRALWWTGLVEVAMARAWIVNNSQREAGERIAHLFCELFIRLRAAGLTNGHSCVIPITQVELADATGLSTVHVNRTLQEMRSAGLIILKGRILIIPDLKALQVAALFKANDLHLDFEGQEIAANSG